DDGQDEGDRYGGGRNPKVTERHGPRQDRGSRCAGHRASERRERAPGAACEGAALLRRSPGRSPASLELSTSPGESGESGEFGEFCESVSAKLELALADLQSPDPIFEGRRGHLKLHRRPRWPGDPSSALGEGSLDDFPFAARLTCGRHMR